MYIFVVLYHTKSDSSVQWRTVFVIKCLAYGGDLSLRKDEVRDEIRPTGAKCVSRG